VQKLTTLEASYRAAADWMRQTGSGVEAEGGDFRTYLLQLCPFYDQLDKVFSTKVNANPPYLNDYSSNDELDVESIPTLDDSLPVTSKRVLAPTTTKEIVRNIKKKTTNNNVSNTLNMLLGTEAEAAALRKAQATAATSLSALENKNRELAITEERLAIHKAEHNMNMRLKEVELKREEMKARMDVLKMRIELKKGDPTISKDELDTFLPLP